MNICMYMFFVMCILATVAEGSFVRLSLDVKVPRKIEKPVDLAPLYFKGVEFRPDYNYANKISYHLVQDEDISVLYILVTEDLSEPQDINIKYLKTAQNYPYRLFKCMRVLQHATDAQNNPGQPVYTWRIEELDNSIEQLILDDNTLIFFFNPAYIDVQPEAWRLTDHILRLPSIVMKESVEPDELASAALRMVCKTPDFRCFHKKLTQTTKMVASNCIISVPNPANCYVM